MNEFTEFFQRIIEPGMLPYTVLLGFVLCYWLIVIIGVIDIDFLEFGDFGLDGALEGTGEGVADGATEALTDAITEGATEGIADAIADGEISLDSPTDAGSMGTFHSVLNFINLGKVPVTVILSFLALKMWVFAYLYYFYLSPKLTSIPGIIVSIVLFSIVFIVGLFLTGLTTRPLRTLFQHVTTHGHHNLLGKICKIKTTLVTTDFGQAELRVDNSFLLLSVRCQNDAKLSRGDEAVITHYNQEKDVYEIRKI